MATRLQASSALCLHGWEANTIAVWQTGKPFTIINSGNGGADNPT